MRGIILISMFAAGFAQAGWNDYEEVRKLELDQSGVSRLVVRAGAGSMDVRGVDGLDKIAVRAQIGVLKADEDKALKVIEKRMVLELKRDGDEARLDSWFEDGSFGLGHDAYIALEIEIPEGLAIDIDDGSGSIDVIDTRGDVTIDDGSGSIDVENVASLKIDDGSGSIDVDGAAGDVSIIDGSGSISVVDVEGSVTIDDGSGSIRVTDVTNDVTIIDGGSGSVTIRDVQGEVEQET